MRGELKMSKIIFDGMDAIFGRISSVVAKELLKGNYVDVINCESIIVSGNKNLFVKKIQAKRNMGRGSSLKGPKYIRQSDRLVKRMIRGMLPRDRTKGQEAFKRLRCYVGKGSFKEGDLKEVKTLSHRKPMRYFTIGEVVKLLK